MQSVPSISIQVQSHYIPEYSLPEADRFVFAYTVTMRNLSHDRVQLLSRYWRITDGNGLSHEVQGIGVVGEQPHIEPGEEFRYTSGLVLSTPVGTMEGHYLMVDNKGQQFQVPMTPFLLALPYIVH